MLPSIPPTHESSLGFRDSTYIREGKTEVAMSSGSNSTENSVTEKKQEKKKLSIYEVDGIRYFLYSRTQLKEGAVSPGVLFSLSVVMGVRMVRVGST